MVTSSHEAWAWNAVSANPSATTYDDEHEDRAAEHLRGLRRPAYDGEEVATGPLGRQEDVLAAERRLEHDPDDRRQHRGRHEQHPAARQMHGGQAGMTEQRRARRRARRCARRSRPCR